MLFPDRRRTLALSFAKAFHTAGFGEDGPGDLFRTSLRRAGGGRVKGTRPQGPSRSGVVLPPNPA